MAASSQILARFGLTREEDVVGRSDYDFFPREIADHFVKDDQQILATGEPIVNRVEIWYNEQRVMDWFTTTKLPVKGRDSQIVGVMGIVRSYEGQRRAMAPFSSVARAIDFIRDNHHRSVTAAELAKAAGLSERQLHRRFREAFDMTPHEFALKTRLQAASDALARTDEPIAIIAIDCGFCDQSAFTVQFRKHTGITPKQFRDRYRR